MAPEFANAAQVKEYAEQIAAKYIDRQADPQRAMVSIDDAAGLANAIAALAVEIERLKQSPPNMLGG